MKIKIFFFLIFIGMYWSSSYMDVHASSGKVDYSVEAIAHPQQLNKNISYFDLMVEPNDSTKLEILLHNTTNQTETFDVAFVDAYTNANGLIVYEKKTSSKNDILSVRSFSEKPQQKVQVKAYSSKKVSIPVNIPANMFKGTFLGGVRVEKYVDDTKKSTIAVSNRYVYVIGVKMTMSLLEESFDPHWKDVTLNTTSYYPALDFKIDNKTASISSPLQVEMILYKKNTVVARQNMEAKFVPYAKAALSFRLQKELQAGKYKTFLKLTDTENRKTWEFKDDLVITERETAAVNQHIKIQKKSSDELSVFWISIIITSVMIFFMLVSYIVYLQRKISLRPKESDIKNEYMETQV